MAPPLPLPPLLAAAPGHAARLAVVTPEGSSSYADLLAASHRAASTLLAGRGDLQEERVAFLASPGIAYPAVLWGIFRAGGVAVPLAVSHPRAELEHAVSDAEATILVAPQAGSETLRSLARDRGLGFMTAEELTAGPTRGLPRIAPSRRAMIVYTSGTTSHPKGAVHTHASLSAQVGSLLAAWAWRPADRILSVLPLHHVHGIVNVLACALAAGATWEVLPSFDAAAVWERIASGEITLFMAVPTIYARLLTAWEGSPPGRRRHLTEAAARLRLWVSGSAALPVSSFERFRDVSGQAVLERYGMTEIGMALSNPLEGERRPGTVGRPLPGVAVRRVDEGGRPLGPGDDAVPGEIEVRGPSVFREYWRRPEATREAFHDGWFRSGDVAVIEEGYFRILGRQSVDIVKTGGFKVSALEIEEVLRRHPAIADCAVVGIPDPEWGERVAVGAVLRPGADLGLEALRGWAAELLAPYKIPTRLLLLEDLPRNPLGKVTKAQLAELFDG